MNKSIRETPILIQPIEDTWGSKGDAATWYINLDSDFKSESTQKINIWYKKSIYKTLNAFHDLARFWKICISPCNYGLFSKVSLEWELEESYENYLNRIIAAIDNYTDAICTLEVHADLLVFVRSDKSSDKPIYA